MNRGWEYEFQSDGATSIGCISENGPEAHGCHLKWFVGALSARIEESFQMSQVLLLSVTIPGYSLQ